MLLWSVAGWLLNCYALAAYRMHLGSFICMLNLGTMLCDHGMEVFVCTDRSFARGRSILSLVFNCLSRASSSRSLAWSMALDAGDWGRGSSSGASCALGRLVGISIMDSGRHASKNRIPGRGVTSLYGPVRSSGLPLRTLKRPAGRQTYAGREDLSAAYPNKIISSKGRSCFGTHVFVPSSAIDASSLLAWMSSCSQSMSEHLTNTSR